MDIRFPEQAWVDALAEKLNTDSRYAETARRWEGDLLFVIEPDDLLKEPLYVYLDLWHGKCRKAELLSDSVTPQAAFALEASYGNFVRVLKGEWHPMQAMMTRKLRVTGDMLYMMRNVPTVLEFVRCAQEVTTLVLGE